MILEYKGIRPKIGKNVFIAPNAIIIGNVVIGDNASIWYGTVIRGDMDLISIGENTNVQDNVTIHTDAGKPAMIAQNVTIGHNAVVHGCTIEPRSLIGINAVVLNEAYIKEGTIVAAGSVVRAKAVFGPGQLVAGIPAAIKKVLSEEEINGNVEAVEHYLILAAEHKALNEEQPYS